MLHTVNKSPYEKNSFDSCLKHAAEGSTVLLIEDGVYAAVKGGSAAAKISDAQGKITFCVLGPDAKARGIADKVMDGVEVVDYAGFVNLAANNDKVQSWL